tara:strand:- start:35 stop:943 length:909 start_codon:yes stop_codon:yes gene_type:complete
MITDKYSEYANRILDDIPFVNFDETDGTFYFLYNDLTISEKKKAWKIVETLRWDNNFKFDCHSVMVKDFNTGYHDKCLENYCYERLIKKKRHKNTCWVMNNSKTYCIGKISKNSPFTDNIKIKFINSLPSDSNDLLANKINNTVKYNLVYNKLKLLNNISSSKDGWITVKLNYLINNESPFQNIIRSLRKIKRQIVNNDYEINLQYIKILEIVENIRKIGWNENLAWATPNTVIGYSLVNNIYFTLTGRHRIAALMYLYNRGEISGSTKINFPVIKYNWRSWLQGTPHPKSQLCDHCSKFQY